jgi:RimK-like ATP-grasp domain
MLQLRALKGPTGRLLGEMLKEKGLLGGKVQGVVNYGHFGEAHVPTLNAKAGNQNKHQELIKLDDAGVRTIPFSHSATDLAAPIFGRKFHHTRGTDIFIYGVRPLLKGDRLSDYYTQLVPKRNEFRVWVYRNKALATYEKRLTYPQKNGRRGRSKEVWNWANGYGYEFVRPEEAADKLKNLAIDAVAALGLDFGAVDVILGMDNRYYVLEVNTAPGVEGRRQGMTSLVNCIDRWARNGFKARRA